MGARCLLAKSTTGGMTGGRVAGIIAMGAAALHMERGTSRSSTVLSLIKRKRSLIIRSAGSN